MRIEEGRSVVAVCGAGFSHVAGLPLQGELAAAVIPEEARHIHNTVRDLAWDAPIDIEEFLTALDFEQSFSKYTKSEKQNLMTPDWFLRRISNSIVNTSVSAFAQNNGNIKVFLKQATEVWRHSNTVITLNWDTLLELYARSEPHQWSLIPHAKHKGRAILKLHGSVDWFPLGSKFHGSPFFENLTGKLWRYKPFSEGDYFSIPDSISDLLESAPAIIAPTHLKEIPRGFRRIWIAAYDALRYADHVLIVGYSLPTADTLLRQLLSLCLWPGRNSTDRARITVIDPDRTGVVASRYGALFGDRVEFIKCPLHEVKWRRV